MSKSPSGNAARHWARCLTRAAPSALGAAERVAGSSELSEEVGNLNFSSHPKILILAITFKR